jgi:competence CoiA-like predicted nuclease
MVISEGRPASVHIAMFAICAMVLASVTGCSEEAVAKRSLKKVVHQEIKQFNKYNQREVKLKIYQSGGRFYRAYKERVDSTTSMRRTNAVDTPYIATIRYTENTYLTQRHSTYAESKKDTHFSLSGTRQGEIIFTYVDGLWRKKEIY